MFQGYSNAIHILNDHISCYFTPFVVDFDECTQSLCSNGVCRNTPGSYSCTCNEGFLLNGDVCEGTFLRCVNMDLLIVHQDQ